MVFPSSKYPDIQSPWAHDAVGGFAVNIGIIVGLWNLIWICARDRQLLVERWLGVGEKSPNVYICICLLSFIYFFVLLSKYH